MGGGVPVDSETLLMIDFVNLKIKSAQFFRGAHIGSVCMSVYRGKCSYVYEYLRLYCVSKKRCVKSSRGKMNNPYKTKNRFFHTNSNKFIIGPRRSASSIPHLTIEMGNSS
jgi:hypothetical protein